MDEKLAGHIGAVLKKAREAQGFRQREVAELIDISLEGYARIERGGMLPSVPTLAKLRTALGVSGDALLGAEPRWTPKPPPDSPELRDMVRLLGRADRSTQRRVLTVARAMVPKPRRRGKTS